jgi:hypothetical protein
MTRTVLALAALAAGANSARAETLPLFGGVPATYIPGTPFQFTVKVPVLTDFTAFNVDLIFATDLPDPPLFVSSAATPVAPGGQYAFPSNATFQSGSSLFGGSPNVTHTFTDTTGAPVVTTTGVNDVLAIVTVSPGATLTGPITISLGANSTFDANAETQYPDPETITIEQANVPSAPVPAPAGAVLISIGGLLLGARKRFARPDSSSR